MIVKLELAFAAAPVQFDIVCAGTDNPPAHKPTGLAVAHHDGTAHTTKGAKCGEQVQGFQKSASLRLSMTYVYAVMPLAAGIMAWYALVDMIEVLVNGEPTAADQEEPL